jgi:hypothetical protein
MSALQDLRARIGALESRFRKETLPYSRLAEGIPRSALVEISGSGKTEALVQFLAEHPQIPVAWIEARFSLFPTALQQRQAKLENLLFIEGKAECAWAATTVLRSQLFPLVAYHAPYGDEKELRRFQLLAERSRATMFLLAESPAENAWPIALSLAVHGRSLRVLRRK